MLGVADRAFDVLPATLIIERALDRCRDERGELTSTDPNVESTHDLIVQAYVQTHGHASARCHSIDVSTHAVE